MLSSQLLPAGISEVLLGY